MNEILYVCKYIIPKGRWKYGGKLRVKPKVIWSRTVLMKKQTAPERF